MDDLGDLEIVQEMIGYLFVDITAYTKLKHIYRLNLEYTEERVQRLYQYLKKNCQSGQRCELWTIDLGAEQWEQIHEELVHLHRTYTTTEELSMEVLTKECDNQKFKSGDYPRMLIIQQHSRLCNFSYETFMLAANWLTQISNERKPATGRHFWCTFHFLDFLTLQLYLR